MRIRTTMAGIAVALAAAVLPLAVNPAPALAATCSTARPVRVGGQIQYSIAVRGAVPRGVRYYVAIRWDAFSSTTYSATVRTFRRNWHPGVWRASGWIQRANGSRLATCTRWQAPGDF